MVILFDAYNMPESIYDLVFSTDQQAMVAKLLVTYMQQNGGEIGKTEMGLFAQKLLTVKWLLNLLVNVCLTHKKVLVTINGSFTIEF